MEIGVVRHADVRSSGRRPSRRAVSGTLHLPMQAALAFSCMVLT
jgi:hypothetical protein